MNPLSGQISQGGYPIEVDNFKSVSLQEKIVRMPKVDNESLRKKSLEEENFKSLRFAHSFKVNLNPQNSGDHYEADGCIVWRLIVKSDSALSLNIVFSKYFVPDGARLFVFDKEMKYILGAFTSLNNKEFKKLGVYPVPGDEIVIQYEEPVNSMSKGEIEIGEINHDFLGIIDCSNRFDRRISEWCHIDVNCESASGLDLQKRSVCRIIAGDEIGTGSLLNNVLQNGKPYVISAFHIYDDPEVAKTSLFDFNYESPYCTELDGFDNQSVSGSVPLAWFDSLDFLLVELSESIPLTYRPYFSGWDARKMAPSNSHVIHHPNGDVKKISHDSGICDSAKYSNRFINFGHWLVRDWESGSTEGGSSGAGLFNGDKRLVGLLSGGDASCDNPQYDFFVRFDKTWNYKSQNNRQLKRWLDPGGTGKLTLDGYDPYESTNKCTFISNFQVEDSIALLPDFKSTEGIYSGNNKMGITEAGEIFTGINKASISGVAFGIADVDYGVANTDLTIRIYSGDTLPVFAVKQFKYPIKKLTANAMNYINFSEPVFVEGNFFITVVLPSGNDSVSIFQSVFRPLILKNTMIIKQDDVWKKTSSIAGETNRGTSLLMQVMLCDYSFTHKIDTIFDEDQLFRLFPNPANDYLIFEFKKRTSEFEFWIYDMAGKEMIYDCDQNRMYNEVDLSSFSSGIYILKVSDGEKTEVRRFIVTDN